MAAPPLPPRSLSDRTAPAASPRPSVPELTETAPGARLAAWTPFIASVEPTDFGRCSLAGDIAPGQEIRIEAQIPPLASPGRYVLRFDLVAAGVRCFADRGTILYAVPIEVTS